MMKKFSLIITTLNLLCVAFCSNAIANTPPVKNPFYLGVAGGYGSSTWGWLVPNEEHQVPALMISMPEKVTEGGGVWGLFTGFEFTQYIAAEVTYLHFQDAKISFSPDRNFAFEHDNNLSFTTETETVSVMAKIMLPIEPLKSKLYSSLGVAEIQRKDMFRTEWRTSPTFGLGLVHNITPHIMADLGANYTAGYAEAQLEPTQVFFPFLYSVALKLSYRL